MKRLVLLVAASAFAASTFAAADTEQQLLPQLDSGYVSAPGQQAGCGLRGTIQNVGGKSMVCGDSGRWVEMKFKSGPRSLVLSLSAPGCVAKGPDGKPWESNHVPGDTVKIPAGSTFSAACFVER
jgi:hypothetical protein